MCVAPDEKPEGKGEWKAGWGDRLHRRGDRWSVSHAEPWTKKHEDAILRDRAVRTLKKLVEGLAKGGNGDDDGAKVPTGRIIAAVHVLKGTSKP